MPGISGSNEFKYIDFSFPVKKTIGKETVQKAQKTGNAIFPDKVSKSLEKAKPISVNLNVIKILVIPGESTPLNFVLDVNALKQAMSKIGAKSLKKLYVAKALSQQTLTTEQKEFQTNINTHIEKIASKESGMQSFTLTSTAQNLNMNEANLIEQLTNEYKNIEPTHEKLTDNFINSVNIHLKEGRFDENLASGSYDETVAALGFSATDSGKAEFKSAFISEGKLIEVDLVKSKTVNALGDKFLTAKTFQLSMLNELSNHPLIKEIGIEDFLKGLGQNPLTFAANLEITTNIWSQIETVANGGDIDLSGNKPHNFDSSFMQRTLNAELPKFLELAENNLLKDEMQSELKTMLRGDLDSLILLRETLKISDANYPTIEGLAALTGFDLDELIGDIKSVDATLVNSTLSNLVALISQTAVRNIDNGTLDTSGFFKVKKELHIRLLGQLGKQLELFDIDETEFLVGVNSVLEGNKKISHKDYLATIAGAVSMLARIKIANSAVDQRISQGTAELSKDLMNIANTIADNAKAAEATKTIKAEEIKEAQKTATLVQFLVAVGVALLSAAITVTSVVALACSAGTAAPLVVAAITSFVGLISSLWALTDAGMKLSNPEADILTVKVLRIFDPHMSEEKADEIAFAITIAITVATTVASLGASAGAAATKSAAQAAAKTAAAAPATQAALAASKAAQTAAQASANAARNAAKLGTGAAKEAARIAKEAADEAAEVAAKLAKEASPGIEVAIEAAKQAVAKGSGTSALKTMARSNPEDLVDFGSDAHVALMKSATKSAAQQSSKKASEVSSLAKSGASETIEENTRNAAKELFEGAQKLSDDFIEATKWNLRRSPEMAKFKGAEKKMTNAVELAFENLEKKDSFVRGAMSLKEASSSGLDEIAAISTSVGWSMIGKETGEKMISEGLRPFYKGIGHASIALMPTLTAEDGRMVKNAIKAWSTKSGFSEEEAEQRANTAFGIIQAIMMVSAGSAFTGYSATGQFANLGSSIIAVQRALPEIASGITGIKTAEKQKEMAATELEMQEFRAQADAASNMRDIFEDARSKNMDAMIESLEGVSSDFAWFMNFVNNLSQTITIISRV